MRAVSDGDEDGDPGASGRRPWGVVVVTAVVVWFLLSGGSLADWFSMRGAVPGTGGVLSKGHLLLLALILVIAQYVLRMPREGGPLVDESGPEDGEPADPEGETSKELSAEGETLKPERAEGG